MSMTLHEAQLTLTARQDGRTDIDRRYDSDRAFLRDPAPPRQDSTGTAVVDLFSSLGGLTYGALKGLEEANRPGHLRLAIDNDPAPLRVLGDTLNDARSIASVDLRSLLVPIAQRTTSAERDLFGGVPRGSALLLAGPPCQGHSALNNHTRHDDPRNDLYLSIARVARLIEPKAIVVENVQWVERDRRSAVALCASALEELGYEVTSRRLDLSRLGVPQTRIRHILVATRHQAFRWNLPHITTRDVRWTIEDLLDHRGTSAFDLPSRPSPENQARIDWLFEHDAHDLPNRLRPPCHRSEHSYRSMYGRLRWYQPAQTITSGFGSMGQGRYVHPLRRRTLTPHEAARLQCLPDFVSLTTETRKTALSTMIGNAAPPLMATRIVEALIDQALI